MPASIIAGKGPRELTTLSGAVPIVPASRIVQIGVRSVDAAEKELVVASGMTVYDMRRIDELRMRTVVEQALAQVAERDVHLHVSFDVDFLDPAIAPGVPSTVPGGPTYREAQLCMEMIHDSGLMASLDVMELNPAYDEGNRTAELAVELVESLFGLQILARAGDASGKYTL
jgi:arginase